MNMERARAVLGAAMAAYPGAVHIEVQDEVGGVILVDGVRRRVQLRGARSMQRHPARVTGTRKFMTAHGRPEEPASVRVYDVLRELDRSDPQVAEILLGALIRRDAARERPAVAASREPDFLPVPEMFWAHERAPAATRTREPVAVPPPRYDPQGEDYVPCPAMTFGGVS